MSIHNIASINSIESKSSLTDSVISISPINQTILKNLIGTANNIELEDKISSLNTISDRNEYSNILDGLKYSYIYDNYDKDIHSFEKKKESNQIIQEGYSINFTSLSLATNNLLEINGYNIFPIFNDSNILLDDKEISSIDNKIIIKNNLAVPTYRIMPNTRCLQIKNITETIIELISKHDNIGVSYIQFQITNLTDDNDIDLEFEYGNEFETYTDKVKSKSSKVIFKRLKSTESGSSGPIIKPFILKLLSKSLDIEISDPKLIIKRDIPISTPIEYDPSEKNEYNDNYSLEWYGYIKAPESGKWNISINPKVNAIVWLGDDALKDNYSDTNYLIASKYNISSKDYKLNMNKYYPIRIMYGEKYSFNYIGLNLKSPSGQIYTNLKNIAYSFKKLDFSNESLSDIDLKNSKIINANLTNVDLSNRDLTNANLSNCNLTNTNLTNTILSFVNLSNSDLSSAIFLNTRTNDIISTINPSLPPDYTIKTNYLGMKNIFGPNVNLSNTNINTYTNGLLTELYDIKTNNGEIIFNNINDHTEFNLIDELRSTDLTNIKNSVRLNDSIYYLYMTGWFKPDEAGLWTFTNESTNTTNTKLIIIQSDIEKLLLSSESKKSKILLKANVYYQIKIIHMKTPDNDINISFTSPSGIIRTNGVGYYYSLDGVNLSNMNLSNADLRSVNLSYSDLTNCNLSNAKLDKAICSNLVGITPILPSDYYFKTNNLGQNIIIGNNIRYLNNQQIMKGIVLDNYDVLNNSNLNIRYIIQAIVSSINKDDLLDALNKSDRMLFMSIIMAKLESSNTKINNYLKLDALHKVEVEKVIMNIYEILSNTQSRSTLDRDISNNQNMIKSFIEANNKNLIIKNSLNPNISNNLISVLEDEYNKLSDDKIIDIDSFVSNIKQRLYNDSCINYEKLKSLLGSYVSSNREINLNKPFNILCMSVSSDDKKINHY